AGKLSQQFIYILLALAIKEQHGYDIMKQVEIDSNGHVKLGPGTLYGAVKRMLQDNLIEEIEAKDSTARYRRLYRLTAIGKSHLTAELEQYQHTVQLAQKHHLLPV